MNKFYRRIENAFSAFRFTRRISKQLKRFGITKKYVSMIFQNNDLPLYDIQIFRNANTYKVIFHKDVNLRIIRDMVKMAPAYIYWLSLCPPEITKISVNGSDGDRVSMAMFTPSSRSNHQIPIVDPHFFGSLGFEAQRQAGRASPSWSERNEDIIWRGAINGNGWLSCNLQDQYNPSLMQRARMVMILRNQIGVDVKLVGWGKTDIGFAHEVKMLGLLGLPIEPRQWLNNKYAIDIDGVTNTWSNLLVRMLFGCCVIKIESQFGYKQWYYDELEPFVHYVPVKSDMSDLLEKIEWVRTHDKEAEIIARQGQEFAQRLTFESQSLRAAQIIQDNYIN